MRPPPAGSLSSHARRSSGHQASRAAAESAFVAEREAQIDSLVRRIAEQRQLEQELRINIENLEAERSREREEAKVRLETVENEMKSWQRKHAEDIQQVQRLRDEKKAAETYHAERMSAAEARSQKQETEIDVLRQELKDAEARAHSESRERASLARALRTAEDRLGGAEVEVVQLRADLDEICRENSELKDRYMTAGERFERLMESEEEHTKELTKQLEDDVKAAREKAERYKTKLQKSQSGEAQLRESLSREQSRSRDREREVDRLMRMVEDERTAKEKALAELSREEMMPARVHEQVVADLRHQAAMQLEDKDRTLNEQWQHRLKDKLQSQKNETAKTMDRIREGIKDLDKQKDELKGENDRLKDEKRQLQEHVTALVDKLETVERERRLLEDKVDEVSEELEKNKALYTVEMNRGLQYQGEVARLQRNEQRQEQQVDDLKAEVDRLRQTHGEAQRILQENPRLKGEISSLTDTVKALERQGAEDQDEIRALQKDLKGEKRRCSRLSQAAAMTKKKLEEPVRRLREDLLSLRSEAITYFDWTADWIATRLREVASEYGSAAHVQLTRHAAMLKDVTSRLEESEGRGTRLREEVEVGSGWAGRDQDWEHVQGLRTATEEKHEELIALKSKEAASRAALAAAREHIAAMVGVMDRVIDMPEDERMGEELADALGKSDTFRHVLSRYDGRVTRRISSLMKEAQGEADSLAASCLELEYRCKKAEAEFRNQSSVRSSLETMATQRSAELEGALERAKALEHRCRDLEKNARSAQADFHDKMHAAVRRTKDGLRAEIDELHAQMVDLRRQFEQEAARVNEEAAAKAAAFKRNCEEKLSEERKQASADVDLARREKERIEHEKKRVEEQLHAVERELSRVLGEKQEIEDETQHIRRALSTAERRLEKDEDTIKAKDDQVAKLSQSRSSEVSRLRRTINEQNGELEHLKSQARKARESRDSIYRIISQTAGRHGIGETSAICSIILGRLVCLFRHGAVNSRREQPTCFHGTDELSWINGKESTSFSVYVEEPDGFIGGDHFPTLYDFADPPQ
ncbi:hypothetical protein Pmar_PMAR000121 [Perkinsus marinus ATCC 50983]|uniref:Uncharacterized protein n=1 Tax=Perkinsus marinus (strain ATCC 50983 / TXsc) TaxID=423536 RepID=C5KPY6_PERM5|nr:hypothetical protein Pmar_PMAR000121 [Perkinsus marinus ATCC 50983]EER13533.1 hypothetical protein Pmar_PMAR000121 [Perkinsus marinus ATCC 50983]|eukprot:XP_002781738.1 hypothetical protein Pmar_PMAR000121 [Perkinsus marinus ATCC 50983]